MSLADQQRAQPICQHCARLYAENADLKRRLETAEERYPKPQRGEQTIGRVFAELRRAEKLHPSWPGNPAEMLAIIGEEYGEACHAFIEWNYRHEPFGAFEEELIQCAAMCLRALIYLEEASHV